VADRDEKDGLLQGLAGPVELLLASGADTRLQIDPATGLNAYGCSPMPRPWAITFSSSTATSISEGAYRAAEARRLALLAEAHAGTLDAAIAGEAAGIRAAIARATGAGEDSAVILTTSGTDAALLATCIARGDPLRPLVSILVGLDETGSGVANAAAGRHFAARTALGQAVESGAPIDGMTGLRVEPIAVRDPAGNLLAASDIDRAVGQAVERAIDDGNIVLLHVLDGSKTGLLAPGLATVQALARQHGPNLVIVIDCCQFRTSAETLARYLDAGWLVLVTGSKFFTGPPFAGAVLVPRAIAERARVQPLPRGLVCYATRNDFPAGWHAATAPLGAALALGKLLRWHAALFEIARFLAVPPDQRRHILARFGDAIVAALGASERLDLLPAPALDRAGFAAPDSWDAVRSIFAFTIRNPADPGQKLDLASLRRIHRELNRDAVDRLPNNAGAAARALAAQACHIGQPVTLGRDAAGRTIAALRIAGGARLVSGVACDESLGPDPAARLAREIADALTALAKIELLLSLPAA
jgi:selenocysteine lyase/cysteine desulfurase